MGMTNLPPAGESPPMAMGTTPPDQASSTLREHLNAALAMLGGDGEITEDEQYELRAFLEGVNAIARQRAGAGRPPLAGAPEQMGRPEEVTEGPYMGHAGTMRPAGI